MSRVMRVKELQLTGKAGDDATCEDAVIANDRFVAVIDGTTSLVSTGEGELSPGKKAVKLVSEMIEKMPGEIAAEDFFRRLNDALSESYRREGIYEKAKSNPEYRTSAAAIVYSRAYSELWLVGDCQALVDDKPVTSWKNADWLLAEVRAMFLESELLEGKTIAALCKEDTGRAFIEPLLVRQKRFQNCACEHPYSYYVLDGFLEDFGTAIETHGVPGDTDQLVLASDGYPVLKPSLQESEDVLREIIRDDPLCFRRYKSTKGVYEGNISFDDRAYVRVVFGDEQSNQQGDQR